jgi:hypothetical protein
MATPLPEAGDVCWYCPLLKREIPEGLCLDINYQRLQVCKADVLTDAQLESGKTLQELSSTCEACPNQPLPEEGRDSAVEGPPR